MGSISQSPVATVDAWGQFKNSIGGLETATQTVTTEEVSEDTSTYVVVICKE
jgi:hypothetical protein